MAIPKPHLGCLPVRGTLITLAIIGIIGSPLLLANYPDNAAAGAGFIAGMVLHVSTLFGVIRYSTTALNLVNIMLMVFLVLNLVLLFTFPIIMTGVVSSELNKWMDRSNPSQYNRSSDFQMTPMMMKKKAEENYWQGVKDGFNVEFVLLLHLAVVYIELHMVERLVKYINMLKGRIEQDPMELEPLRTIS